MVDIGIEDSRMKYYAMIDGERRGPYELDRLAEAGVRPETYVWCKGMADWEKAEDVADICRMYRNRIHDLMHPSSVEAEQRKQQAAAENLPTATESTQISPSRFSRYMNDPEQMPTIEQIDEQQDIDQPPRPMMGLAIAVTLLCFPPTGIAAIIFARKSKKAWEEGEHKQAHDYCRSAKMSVGISFFLGLILYAFLFQFF